MTRVLVVVLFLCAGLLLWDWRALLVAAVWTSLGILAAILFYLPPDERKFTNEEPE